MQLLDFEHDNEGNLVGVTVDYDGERIELERVRHGEWIVERRSKFPRDGVSIKCSLCGRYEYKKEPYCHCGAMMDGGKQDV